MGNLERERKRERERERERECFSIWLTWESCIRKGMALSFPFSHLNVSFEPTNKKKKKEKENKKIVVIIHVVVLVS